MKEKESQYWEHIHRTGSNHPDAIADAEHLMSETLLLGIPEIPEIGFETLVDELVERALARLANSFLKLRHSGAAYRACVREQLKNFKR